MGYAHLMKHVVVQGAYFLMNCVTFVLRFLIFHYLLFTNKSRDEEAAATVGADLATAESVSVTDTGPLALVHGDPAPPDR
jgi:hypothetical protein